MREGDLNTSPKRRGKCNEIAGAMRRMLDEHAAPGTTFVSLRQRLLRSHLTVATIGVVLVAFAIGAAVHVRTATLRLTTETEPAIQAATRALSGLDRATAALRAWITTRDPGFARAHTHAWAQDVAPAVAALRPLAAHWEPNERRWLEEASERLGELRDAHARARRAGPDPAAAKRALEAHDSAARTRRAVELLTAIAARQQDRLRADAERVVRSIDAGIAILLALLAVAGAIALRVSVTAAERVTRPIAVLAAATGALADRTLSEDLPILRDDEIGVLTRTFNRMRASVVDAERALTAQAAEARDAHAALQQLNAELEQRVLERTAELCRSNEELERFAAVASHDLQEPLRMVASYTQLLSDRYHGRLDGDADEFIAYALDGARRMQRLIRDLLAYARVSTRPRPEELVDAGLVFERAVANLRLAISERAAVVTAGTLPRVRVDASQLGQLLQNVIDNALKHGGDDREVRVHVGAERRGDAWLFSVRDNGVGIPPEHAERVFALFARVQRGPTHPGSGIGLALCKKIVERHGGRIWIERAESGGCVVCFTLPSPPDAAAAAYDHDAAGGRATVPGPTTPREPTRSQRRASSRAARRR